MKQQYIHRNERDEHMSIEELKAQMAKDAKRDALKCLRSTRQQLCHAADQINEFI